MGIKQSFELVVLFLACCFPFVILWIHKLQSIHSEVIKEANDTISLQSVELRIVEAELTATQSEWQEEQHYRKILDAELKLTNDLLTKTAQSKERLFERTMSLQDELDEVKDMLIDGEFKFDELHAEYRHLQHEVIARSYELAEVEKFHLFAEMVVTFQDEDDDEDSDPSDGAEDKFDNLDYLRQEPLPPVPTPKLLTVNVTADHISRGRPDAPLECPISLAFQDLDIHHVEVQGASVRRFNRMAYLPEEAKQFVVDFDYNAEPKPFSFQVPLVENWFADDPDEYMQSLCDGDDICF